MFWLNVDLPTRIWKLHREDCLYCKPSETPSKGLEEMRGSGGWFSFKTAEEAHEFYLRRGKRYLWQPCKICMPDVTQ